MFLHMRPEEPDRPPRHHEASPIRLAPGPEFDLIRRFLAGGSGEGARADVHVGPGDDCAVVAAPAGRYVITTDTQVQDQDFRLAWTGGAVTTGYDTGVKCAAQNLADVAAMGAVPSAAVVAARSAARSARSRARARAAGEPMASTAWWAIATAPASSVAVP